jgi:hypothetical protein
MEFVLIGICAPHPYLVFTGIKDFLPGTDKLKGRGGINFLHRKRSPRFGLTLPEITYRPGSRRYRTAHEIVCLVVDEVYKGYQPRSEL